jgi:hypothetical protein
MELPRPSPSTFTFQSALDTATDAEYPTVHKLRLKVRVLTEVYQMTSSGPRWVPAYKQKKIVDVPVTAKNPDGKPTRSFYATIKEGTEDNPVYIPITNEVSHNASASFILWDHEEAKVEQEIATAFARRSRSDVNNKNSARHYAIESLIKKLKSNEFFGSFSKRTQGTIVREIRQSSKTFFGWGNLKSNENLVTQLSSCGFTQSEVIAFVRKLQKTQKEKVSSKKSAEIQASRVASFKARQTAWAEKQTTAA